MTFNELKNWLMTPRIIFDKDGKGHRLEVTKRQHEIVARLGFPNMYKTVQTGSRTCLRQRGQLHGTYKLDSGLDAFFILVSKQEFETSLILKELLRNVASGKFLAYNPPHSGEVLQFYHE